MNSITNRLRLRLSRLFRRRPRPVWVSHPLFSHYRCIGGHPESPERIEAVEAEVKKQGFWHIFRNMTAPEASDSQLALVHTRTYLRLLESAQPPSGKIYRLDDDTVMGSEALDTARYAAGAVVSAVDMVMRGDAYHAFCAVRPPGHHAQSGQAGGFCLINNVAVGVMYAIARFRLKRIAVIDFDVHYGDGTAEIFKDDSRVLFLNSYEQNLFPFPDCGGVQNNSAHTVHLAFPAGSGSLDFRKAVREQWLPKLSAFKPELVLLSAGFDGHKLDETGRLNLHEADYAWLTHKIIQTASNCKGKIVSVLEGGYTLDSLACSAAAHLYVLAGLGKPECALIYDRYLNHGKNI